MHRPPLAALSLVLKDQYRCDVNNLRPVVLDRH